MSRIKRARRAFELLCEVQDIKHELQDMKLVLATCKHTDKQVEQTINKSQASLNELIECCTRTIRRCLWFTTNKEA